MLDRDPGAAPFESHLGWVLPLRDGSLQRLDFTVGRAVNLPRPQPQRRQRKRVATRPQFDKKLRRTA